jgi:hypothetical protein
MRVPIFPLFLLIIGSCTNKFENLKKNYHLDPAIKIPDYSLLNYWAAHPWKHDPSDSIPEPLINEVRDSVIDVFFVHPTTYISLFSHSNKNAVISDNKIAATTDYTNILYYSSVFNQHCRIFAPRYRQLHMSIFLRKRNKRIEAAYDSAYTDVRNAFKYYLAHYNNGRPFIIAGHSQGSYMAEKLLLEFVENKSLKQQLVVAYLPGWSILKNYFTDLKICKDSVDTGCLCSWRTFRNAYIPIYLKNKSENSYVTNPLTWTVNGDYAPKTFNAGSIFFDFNRIYPNSTGAIAKHGLLWISKPKFPHGFFMMTKNYHPFDYKLFYMNIRHNVEQRIFSYAKSHAL